MAGINRLSGAMSKLNPIKFIDKAFQKDPEKALAYMTVGSIVAKDGIGCYKYVTQSLKNKEIPEERRNFVAALDLTNGVLMIAAQIGMFFLMRRFSEPIFDRIFKSSFGEKATKFLAERVRMLQKSDGVNSARKLEISKELQKKVRKDALDAFKFVSEIAAATIVGKRIIVPFVATPLANVVKGKMEERNAKKAAEEVEDVKEVGDDD